MNRRTLFTNALLVLGSALIVERGSFAQQQPPTTLQITEVSVGTGAVATAGQTVRVHYDGWLFSSGQKFDSSRDRSQPFVFPLGAGRVIRGWDQGVVGMRVGGRRRLTIPPHLAYGTRGAPPVIGPNQTLVFEIELLAVN